MKSGSPHHAFLVSYLDGCIGLCSLFWKLFLTTSMTWPQLVPAGMQSVLSLKKIWKWTDWVQPECRPERAWFHSCTTRLRLCSAWKEDIWGDLFFLCLVWTVSGSFSPEKGQQSKTWQSASHPSFRERTQNGYCHDVFWESNNWRHLHMVVFPLFCFAKHGA